MSHPYHDHLDNCQQCRENPFSQCPEGNRTLREQVDSGCGGEYDRTLDAVVNGRKD